MNSDRLHVSGIRAYGYVGVYPEEKTLGQWYEVDLTLWLDLAKAGHSDRLEDTHDYSADVKAIQTLIKTAQFDLIERLAEAIAHLVLQSPEIHQVAVKLTKVAPAIPDFMGSVSVEITRAQSQ
jgi:7,8-dihydroneopterin aldolase/epimerase/oxygenase